MIDIDVTDKGRKQKTKMLLICTKKCDIECDWVLKEFYIHEFVCL